MCGVFNCKTRGIRNIELANALVWETLEILEHVSPVLYVIENPATGRLHQPFHVEFKL